MTTENILKPQKYKIYLNEVEILLLPSVDINMEQIQLQNSIVIHYNNNKGEILEVLLLIEKFINPHIVIIHHEDFERLKEDFKSFFTEILAAGGLVRNEFDEFLFIFRHGSWDLPKGHIEKNEKKRETAIREIEEETGVKELTFVNKIITTRHIFRNNIGRRIIKKSYWFLFETKKQETVCQKSEGIEKVEWMTLEAFFAKKRKVYPNILDVIHSQNPPNASNGKKYVKKK